MEIVRTRHLHIINCNINAFHIASSLSSSPEVPSGLLSLRSSMSVDLKLPHFDDTLSSVTGEYEACHNYNECLDMVPYNAYQHNFQQSLQSELSARFLNRPPLDRTLYDSVVEESFDFGHDTYDNYSAGDENHHVLSTRSKQQSVPKCVFSLYVRMQLCTKMTLQQVS